MTHLTNAEMTGRERERNRDESVQGETATEWEGCLSNTPKG